MKNRPLSILLYAATAVCLGAFFDGLYGGEPIVRHLALIHVATAGAALFAVACLICFFTLRVGSICGLLACGLSWCYFGIEVAAVPWRDLIWFSRFRSDTLFALVALTVSSVDSLTLLTRFFCRPRSLSGVSKAS